MIGQASDQSPLGAADRKAKVPALSNAESHARKTPRVKDRIGGNMALLIVRHRHEAARCPATDPYMGAGILNYLSRPNVRRQGVEIRGEAIVKGEHTLYMIVESAEEERVREF